MIIAVLVGVGVAALYVIVAAIFLYLRDRARSKGYDEGRRDGVQHVIATLDDQVDRYEEESMVRLRSSERKDWN